MILGIDLGEKNTGLAISQGQISTPYSTINHKNFRQALSSIVQTIELESIDTVIIGYVEGKIKPMFEKFAKELKKELPHVRIVMFDETLTTGQARDYMIKLHVPKTKRSQKEHQIAAAILLQSYLDSKKVNGK